MSQCWLTEFVWVIFKKRISDDRRGNHFRGLLEERCLRKPKIGLRNWHLHLRSIKLHCQVINNESPLFGILVGGLVIELDSCRRFREVFPTVGGGRSDEMGAEGDAVAALSSDSLLKDGNFFSRLKVKENTPGSRNLVASILSHGCSQRCGFHRDERTPRLLLSNQKFGRSKVVVHVLAGVDDGREGDLVRPVRPVGNCKLSKVWVENTSLCLLLVSQEDILHRGVLVGDLAVADAVVLVRADRHVGVKHLLVLVQSCRYLLQQIVEVRS